jgi:hypothetical protein
MLAVVSRSVRRILVCAATALIASVCFGFAAQSGDRMEDIVRGILQQYSSSLALVSFPTSPEMWDLTAAGEPDRMIGPTAVSNTFQQIKEGDR